MGVKYVIVGHSERRRYFGETDETVNKKVLAALEAGLKPIMCVGRRLKSVSSASRRKLKCRLKLPSAASRENIRKIVIAYEPVWAIGTGKPQQSGRRARSAPYPRHRALNVWRKAARSISILYGVHEQENAGNLLPSSILTAGLSGAHRLNPGAFKAIVDAANQ